VGLIGLFLVLSESLGASILGAVAIGVLCAPVGAAFAWRMAYHFAARSIWYRCELCGAGFRSREPATRCGGCDTRQDDQAVAAAIAGFGERYRRIDTGDFPRS
jgi:hypothetical protein